MDPKTLKNLQDRTDAKLRYAEIHLKELKDHEPLGGDDFDRAHQESFLFHLLGARDAFLFELNECYDLNFDLSKISFQYFSKELKKRNTKIQEFDAIVALQKNNTSWLYHAKEMRNFSTHVSNVSRSYHIGGPNDQKVWLKNPKSGNIIERHFVDEFNDWFQEMKSLLMRLRQSAICNNS